eukprot:gene7017-7231_t
MHGLQQYPDDYHLVAAAASTAAKLGDAAQALHILSPALQEQPHNVRLLTAAAAAYSAQKDFAAARRCYHLAAATHPTNYIVLSAWGVMEASVGNTAAAVSIFKQALAIKPAHVPAYVAWARLEAARGRVKEARHLHQQAHLVAPRHVPNIHVWAELESSDGQWLAAIKLLEAALQANSRHLPSWMALGKAYWALGDSATCRAGVIMGSVDRAGLMSDGQQQQEQHADGLLLSPELQHELDDMLTMLNSHGKAVVDPCNPVLRYQLAQLHLREGDLAAAEEHLQALEAVDGSNGFLCHCRGLLAQQQGQLSEAKEWFSKGMQAPALAELHAFMGNASAARAVIAAGLSLRRPTGRFLRTAGLVEKRLGDAAAAAKLLARATAVTPRDYKSWLARAVLERRRRDYAAAARCFQRGTACAPHNPHIWYTWADMTWKDLRDPNAARRLYEQATTCCPRNAPLWMEWAMLEWDVAGNQERARQLFQRGASVPVSYQHPPLYQAWAEREQAAGNTGRAALLTERSYQVAKAVQGRLSSRASRTAQQQQTP